MVPIYLLVSFTALEAVKPEGGITPWDYLASHKETALVEVAKAFFIGGGIMLLIGEFSYLQCLLLTLQFIPLPVLLMQW